MPAGQHEPVLTHTYRHTSLTNGDESAASILQSVKEQEAQFEQLTRELEAERQSVANQLERCKLGSETASMSSISSTDDSFHWRGQQTVTTDSHLEEGSDPEESKMSGSQLVDSCLNLSKEEKLKLLRVHPQRRVLQERGLMGGEDPLEGLPNNQSGYSTGPPMDNSYHQDPYHQDPYRMTNGPTSFDPHRSNSPHGSLQSGGSNRPGQYAQVTVTKTVTMTGPGSVSSLQNDERSSNYASYPPLQQPRSLDSPAGSGPRTPTRGAPRWNPESEFTPDYNPDYNPPQPGYSPYFEQYDQFQSRNDYENAPYDGHPNYDRDRPPEEYDRYPDDDRYRDIPQGNSSYANLPPIGGRFSPNGDPYGNRPYNNDSYVNYPPPEEDRYSDRGPPDDRYGNRPPANSYDYRNTPPVDDQYRQSPFEGNRYGDPRPGDSSMDDPRREEESYRNPPQDQYPSYGDYHDNQYPPREDYRGNPPEDDRYPEQYPRDDDPYRNPPRDDDPYRNPPHDDDPYRHPPQDEDPYRHPPQDEDRYGNPEERYDPHRQGEPPRPDDRDGLYPPREDDHYPPDGQYPPDDRYRDDPRDDDRYRDPPPQTGEPYDDRPREEERYPRDEYDAHPTGADPYGYPPREDDRFSDRMPPQEDPYSRGNPDPEKEHYRRTPSPASDRYGPPGYSDRSPGSQPPADPRYPEDLQRTEAYPVMAPGGYDPARRSPSIDSTTRDRWRNPDLPEVIDFLGHPSDAIKANAAAYLQHLCYMDDPIKGKTRALGGIPALVELLNNEIPEVHKNACGALLNMSHGKSNTDNKRAIKNAGGIPALIRLLRKTPDNDVRELVTGILWNLSSCKDIKKPIIDDGLTVIVNTVIIPHSGWDRNLDTEDSKPRDVYWSTVFRNASGVLRNISSDEEYARKKLRECEGLVDSLLHLVRAAIGKNDIDNKSVENCVCVLRNLSFRCQEVDDPDFHKKRQTLRRQQPQNETTGCFGGNKKKKEPFKIDQRGRSDSGYQSGRQRSENAKGMELLWQPEIVHVYLPLLTDCSNPETLEAAAGAIQNLAACDWQPSVDIREAVRIEKGLPIIVELLGIEADRVVCATAIALRNLALDQRTKELIGKYAMRQLVMKLPKDSHSENQSSNDTIAAIIATLHEIIRGNAGFAQSLLSDQGGVERLMHIKGAASRYNQKVYKYTCVLLNVLWQFTELRPDYKKHGWKEHDFVTKSLKGPMASPNSTLNRPHMGQSNTSSGYKDTTMTPINRHHGNPMGYQPMEQDRYGRKPEHIPMNEVSNPGYATIDPARKQNHRDNRDDYRGPPGGVPLFPNLPPGQQPQPQEQPREPLYAQVDKRSKRRQDNNVDSSQRNLLMDDGNYSYGGHSNHLRLDSSGSGGPGADSWV